MKSANTPPHFETSSQLALSPTSLIACARRCAHGRHRAVFSQWAPPETVTTSRRSILCHENSRHKKESSSPLCPTNCRSEEEQSKEPLRKGPARCPFAIVDLGRCSPHHSEHLVAGRCTAPTFLCRCRPAPLRKLRWLSAARLQKHKPIALSSASCCNAGNYTIIYFSQTSSSEPGEHLCFLNESAHAFAAHQ